MLEKVKRALRISTDAFDGELADLIKAAALDLGIAGVVIPDVTEESDESDGGDDFNALITRATITFCKMSFGLPEDYDRLKKSYDEQKAQLSNATGYTDWKVNRNV